MLRLGDGGANGFAGFFARAPGNGALDETRRVVDEDASGLARRSAENLTATRVSGVQRHRCRLHGGRVRELRVSVDALEVDGIVRQRASECLVRGEACVAPLVLVPSAADDPLSGGDVLRSRDDARDDLIIRPGADEVDRLKRLPESEQVGVRVDHAGDDCASPEVEHARGGSLECHRFAHRAGEGNASVAHGQGGNDGARVVDRVDAGVGDDQVGGSSGLRFKRSREQQCEKNRSRHGIG